MPAKKEGRCSTTILLLFLGKLIRQQSPGVLLLPTTLQPNTPQVGIIAPFLGRSTTALLESGAFHSPTTRSLSQSSNFPYQSDSSTVQIVPNVSVPLLGTMLLSKDPIRSQYGYFLRTPSHSPKLLDLRNDIGKSPCIQTLSNSQHLLAMKEASSLLGCRSDLSTADSPSSNSWTHCCMMLVESFPTLPSITSTHASTLTGINQ